MSDPVCPICPADLPHTLRPNRGKAGGWLCDGCGFLLTENTSGDNKRKRDLWSEETRPAEERSPAWQRSHRNVEIDALQTNGDQEGRV